VETAVGGLDMWAGKWLVKVLAGAQVHRAFSGSFSFAQSTQIYQVAEAVPILPLSRMGKRAGRI